MLFQEFMLFKKLCLSCLFIPLISKLQVGNLGVIPGGFCITSFLSYLINSRLREKNWSYNLVVPAIFSCDMFMRLIVCFSIFFFWIMRGSFLFAKNMLKNTYTCIRYYHIPTWVLSEIYANINFGYRKHIVLYLYNDTTYTYNRHLMRQ